MIQPLFFSSAEESEETIKCDLCPRRCLLAPGRGGKCKVRFNRGGKGDLPFYGYVTALARDPIEKKPLYHFRPGTEILSAGFAGCNLHCPFCQNWQISQKTDVPGQTYSPARLIKTAQSAIAYTYSEPLVHIEFLLDCMKEARKAGIANVLVSNGCINSEAAKEILSLCDAANIDLKCFSEETYSEVLGGNLKAVMGFIRTALEKNVHLELTTLVVPGLNDSRAELDKAAAFISELQTEERAVPWHLSAYHPDYKWKEAATDFDFLVSAAERAREKLEFVYTGNITQENNTHCPNCGKVLIRRRSYSVNCSALSLREENGRPAYFCASCGEKAPVFI